MKRKTAQEPGVVLVLEDNEAQRAEAVRLAKRRWRDRNIVPTATVEQALDATRIADVYAALIDLVLPDGYGWQVIARLREMSERPAMVITGKPEPEAIDKALTEGVALFASKPLIAEVVAAYDTLLQTAVRDGLPKGMPVVLGLRGLARQVLHEVIQQKAEQWELRQHLTRALFALSTTPDRDECAKALGVNSRSLSDYRSKIALAARKAEGHRGVEAALVSIQLEATAQYGEAVKRAESLVASGVSPSEAGLSESSLVAKLTRSGIFDDDNGHERRAVPFSHPDED